MLAPPTPPLRLHSSRDASLTRQDYVDLVVQYFGIAVDRRVPPPILMMVSGRDPARGKIHAAELDYPSRGVCGAGPSRGRRDRDPASYWSVLGVLPDDRAVTAVAVLQGRSVDCRRLCRRCFDIDVAIAQDGEGGAGSPDIPTPKVTLTLSLDAIAFVAAMTGSAADRAELAEVGVSDAVREEICRAFPVSALRQWAARRRDPVPR